MEKAKHDRQFRYYLAFIFAYATDQTVDTRSTAGLVLKNNLRQWVNVSSHQLEYIKEAAENALVDQNELIRTVAGTIITTIVAMKGIIHWPGILQRYMELAENQDPVIQEVYHIYR